MASHRSTAGGGPPPPDVSPPMLAEVLHLLTGRPVVDVDRPRLAVRRRPVLGIEDCIADPDLPCSSPASGRLIMSTAAEGLVAHVIGETRVLRLTLADDLHVGREALSAAMDGESFRPDAITTAAPTLLVIRST